MVCPDLVVVAITTMIDLSVAWLKYQVRAGETALALRQSGATWRQIADELRLADETHARRCAALFLSADLASREHAARTAENKEIFR
jgi:hypothetical protein